MYDNTAISCMIHWVISCALRGNHLLLPRVIIRMAPSQYFLSVVRRKGSSQTELVHGCSFWSVFYRNVHGEVGWAPTSHAIGGRSAYKVVEDAS